MDAKAPTRMSKKDLVEALKKAGYNDEQLKDKDTNKPMKRPELLEMFVEHQKGEHGLDVIMDSDLGVRVTAESDTDIIESPMVADCAPRDNVVKENLVPTKNDPEWTQYVLGLFMDDEVDGKNPRVEGLRRVSEILVGELIEEGCDLISAPTESNRFRACVKAWGVFAPAYGPNKRFEALADATIDNCFEDYATFLVAMADTRAKGRMFRNALGLRRVVAAEEINKTFAITSEIQPGGNIHVGQITVMRMMAEQHGFSIPAVLDKIGIEYEVNEKTGDANLKTLDYEQATLVVKHMREMIDSKQEKNNG